MAETSERKDQPDRQDGRKRANGDDGNFEMNVIIPASQFDPTQRPMMLRGLKWILVCTENPIRLDGAMESPKLAE
jgi:hypothetical protein